MKVKKFLSALIAGAMLLGLTAIPAFAADEGLVKDSDGAYIIEDYEDLAYFGKNVETLVPGGSNVTVKMEKDIDLRENAWEPIVMNNFGRTLIFDGQGHTIKNMKSNLTDNDVGFFGRVENSVRIAIKNLTIDSSSFVVTVGDKGADYNTGAGAFIGWSETKTTALENCKVTNSTVSNGKNTGGLVGYIAGAYGDEDWRGDFVNCIVENCTLKSGYKPVGAIAGYVCIYDVPANVVNCTVKNNTIDDANLEMEGETAKYPNGSAVMIGRANGNKKIKYAGFETSGNKIGENTVTQLVANCVTTDSGIEEVTSGAVITGKGYFDTFADALTKAGNGDTIYVIGTVKPTEEIGFGNKNITVVGGTFDATGKTDNVGEGMFKISSNVTFKDVNVTGKVDSEAGTDFAWGYSIFRLYENATLEIQGGKIELTDSNSKETSKKTEIVFGGAGTTNATVILDGTDVSVNEGERICAEMPHFIVKNGAKIYAKDLKNNAFRNAGLTVDNSEIKVEGCEYGVKNTENGCNLTVVGNSKIDITTTPTLGGMTYYMSNGAYIDTSKATSTDPLCQNKSTGRIDGESANKAAQAAGFTTEEGTTSTIDVLTVSGGSVSDNVTFEYEIDYNGKKYPVGAEFDTTGTEVEGSLTFGIFFYNIPNGAKVGTATIK